MTWSIYVKGTRAGVRAKVAADTSDNKQATDAKALILACIDGMAVAESNGYEHNGFDVQASGHSAPDGTGTSSLSVIVLPIHVEVDPPTKSE